MKWCNKMALTDNLFILIGAAVLFSTSTMLIAFTGWRLTHLSYFFWITDLGVELSSAVLILAGGLLCLPAAWLMNMAPYHPNSLGFKFSLICLSSLALILLGQGINGISGLSKSARDHKAVNSSMFNAMALIPYYSPVKKSFDDMQNELKCCGVQTNKDYQNQNMPLLPSCCGLGLQMEERCEKATFELGCLRPALDEMRNFTNGISFLACTVIVTALLNMCMAAQILVSNESKVPKKVAPRVAPITSPFHVTCVTQPAPLSFIPPPSVPATLL